ncbi:MAG: carbon storage regulator [Acidimicrobiales bacterium]
MLVLNRRAGESIVIENGVQLSVLSVSDHKVWLCIEAPGVEPAVRVSATAVSETEARIEIGAPVAVEIDDQGARVEVASAGHPSIQAQATVGFNRRVGESVAVGDGLRVGLASLTKGNPSLMLEGPDMADGLTITLIRPVGRYVRIGVDAPQRRVYRKELWDDVMAANKAAAGDEDLTSLLEPSSQDPDDCIVA